MEGYVVLDTDHLILGDVMVQLASTVGLLIVRNLFPFCTHTIFISAKDLLFWFDFLSFNCAVFMRVPCAHELTCAQSYFCFLDLATM